MTRKPRQRPDRIIAPDAHETPGLIACGAILAPLDEVVRELEAKWGCDRLPRLVSVETAAKFGSALEKLERAIDSNDPHQVQARVEIMIRGWQVLDREASESGCKPLPAAAWAFRVGDTAAVIVRHREAAQAVSEANPDATVYTLEEIGNLVEVATGELAPRIAEAKGIWPGAEVTDVRPKAKREKIIDDEIPF